MTFLFSAARSTKWSTASTPHVDRRSQNSAVSPTKAKKRAKVNSSCTPLLSCRSVGTWMSHWSCHVCGWVTHVNDSCHTYEWVMSHMWMSHVTHVNESCHTYEWVMSHIWISHVTHAIESWCTYEWVMSYIWNGPTSIDLHIYACTGWRRVIGCLI